MSVSQKKLFHLDDFEKAFYEVFARKSIGVGCIIERLRYWNKEDPSSERHNAPHVGMAVTEPWDGERGYQFGMVWEDSGTYATTEFWTYVLNERFEDGSKKWRIVWKEPRLEDVFRVGVKHGFVIRIPSWESGSADGRIEIELPKKTHGPDRVSLAYDFGKPLMEQERGFLEKLFKAFAQGMKASGVQEKIG